MEMELRRNDSLHVDHLPTKHWDDTQLRQQLAHAEEMMRRWDRRAQTHRRLAEVQSHLKTRSPYRRTTEGSLIPIAEKYLARIDFRCRRATAPLGRRSVLFESEVTRSNPLTSR